MSPHFKMSDSVKSFTCKVHNLFIKIIKYIQASNEQYKFRAGLHKYHNEHNVEDYFMIQIRPERCHLKANHKL
jgi:hypothetical protein